MIETISDEKLLELWKEYKVRALEKAPYSDLMQTTARKSFYSSSEEAAHELTIKAAQTQSSLNHILVDQIATTTDYWDLLTPIFVEPQRPEIEPLQLICLPHLKSPDISSMPSYTKKPILQNVTYADMQLYERQQKSTGKQQFYSDRKIYLLVIVVIILIMLLSGS